MRRLLIMSEWELPLRCVPVRTHKDTTVVWNNIRLCYEQKLFGQVTSTCYNHSGTVLGCTSTNQLALLRVPQTDGAIVNEQKERKMFCIRFRDDDKLYIQAVDQRVIVKSAETAFERQFPGHNRDVRSVLFIGRHNFASSSDDTTVRVWDLLHEGELDTGRAHTDYVRCMENYSDDAFFSGSYDHVVHLWDARAGLRAPLQSTTAAAMTHAVEALCYSSSTHILSCASGDQLVLFDMRKGLSSSFHKSSLHTKAITAVVYDDAHQTYITGSLDGRLKMTLLSDNELVCTANKRFSDPISAVAVHPTSREIVVGTTQGDLQVFALTDTASDGTRANGSRAPAIAVSKNANIQEKLHAVQHQLKNYQYSRAFKTALYSRQHDVILSTVEELLRRGSLHIALSNQNDRTVASALRFATEYVDKPQFTDTMIAVFEEIFAIYSTSVAKSAFLQREILIARKRIGASLAALLRMKKTESIMEMIVEAE